MSSFRRVVEVLSRDRALWRRLPATAGGRRVLVTPDSAIRYWRYDLASVDPLLFQLAAELVTKGATVWDVGANVGLFSFAAAFHAGPGGRVVSLEADCWLASLLQRSAGLAAPADAPVSVLPVAVADRVGVTDFHVAARGRAASFLGRVTPSSQAGGTRVIQKTVTVTLDWLHSELGPPTLIKLDVEGAESACLQGGESVLANARPVLICEVSAATRDSVGEILRRHDYVTFDAAEKRRVACATPPWNTLAVPKERVSAPAEGPVPAS